MTDNNKTSNTSSSAPFSTKQTVQVDKGLHGAANLRPQKPAQGSGGTQSNQITNKD
jgi:hypothetical protein